MPELWTFTWLTGPDAGAMTTVGGGAHVVGRAPAAAIRCDDDALEPHHLMVDVDGPLATLRQLGGRLPVRIGGEPMCAAVALTGTATVEIGDSLLAIAPGDLTAPGQSVGEANIVHGATGRVVVRRPRAAPCWEPAPIEPLADHPAANETGGGLLPAVLALVGAAVLAVLTRQPMFLLFGGIGAIVAIGTWGGQRIGVGRRRRRGARSRRDDGVRFERELAAQRAAFVAHRAAHDSTAVTAHRVIERMTPDLWSRRGEHADAYHVALGLGPLSWEPALVDRPGTDRSRTGPLNEAVVPDQPVLVDLGVGCRLAVRGSSPRAHAVVRSLILQIAANCGPADVRFVVVTHEPSRWTWLRRLPHLMSCAGTAMIVAECELTDTVAALDVAGVNHLVFATDDAGLLAARTSPLRRLINVDGRAGLIAIIDEGAGVPHVCTSLFDIATAIQARWHGDAALTSLPIPVRWAGIGDRAALRLAERLHGLIDPEDPMNAIGGIPQSVSMADLLGPFDASSIAAMWLAGGVDPPPRSVIGTAADGVVDIDLVRDGPHALLAGTTGSGKSELLRSLVAGLAVGSSPEQLNIVLIDYKGGATFDACADLPHVVGVVTDLDDRLANRALRSLQAELRRREAVLREVGASDLTAYRLATSTPLARLVVVIDEFATLVAEQPDFLHALVGIAQRGRSLGVHLILATQRPNGVISEDIRANTNLRVALRLHDSADAVDVVGDRSPAAIPRGVPGRAVMRLGPDEVLSFQTAHCTTRGGDGQAALGDLVAAVREAAELIGVAPSHAPWLPPLPPHLSIDAVDPTSGVVGMADDPDRQRTLGLRWSPTDGHLLLVGVKGSGVTSTLTLLGSVAALQGCHLYVVDGHGDSTLDGLTASPRCGAVVRLHERERLIRLVGRLGRELTRRAESSEPAAHPIVLLVDGFDLVRSALDEFETAREYETLEAIVATGAAHGITVVAAFDRVAAVPTAILGRCPRRWVFRLADSLDAVALGIHVADVPHAGPGRIFDTVTGLEAQLGHGDAGVANSDAADAPTPVTALASMIDALSLPRGARRVDGISLPVGVRFDTGEPGLLDVPDGEHLLLLGPARSGRTTALQRIVDAWLEANPAGWWCVVAPRRSGVGGGHRYRSLAEVIDDVPADGHVLLAVDDAELVDDVDGRLAALAGSRRPELMIAAAGKPDSLRHSYGHWSAVVRRSRLGLISAAATDLDADLLAVTVPRYVPVQPRPGLMWVVADGAATLVQVAMASALQAAARS